jgi:outer membrane protein
MKFRKAIVAGVTMLFFAGSAAAQDLPVPDAAGFDHIIGAAVVMLPDYQGSDTATVAGAPILQYKFSEERYVQVIGNKLFINVLNHPNFELGPKAVYRFGRNHVDDKAVEEMKKVDGSIELGGFLGYKQVFDGDIRHRMNIHADMTQDVSNGHDGWVIDLAAIYWRPVAKALDLGIRGNLSYASDDYMSTYFSVNATDSATSGLKKFNAGSGFKDVSLAAMGLFHLSENWHLGGTLMYQRLVGDASDSPVVNVGSEDQVFGGLALLYSW